MPYELTSFRKRNGSTVYIQESEDGREYTVGQVDKFDIIEWEMEFDTKTAAFRKFHEEQERDA